jgi:hypothetical protein
LHQGRTGPVQAHHRRGYPPLPKFCQDFVKGFHRALATAVGVAEIKGDPIHHLGEIYGRQDWSD